ncbi:MAG: chemotaxis protein CheB, partial [archaeon]|nr:chemotaxis protein CheB [archaeon]
AEIFRNNVMYMILTGMGNDGSINIHLLKRFGGITLAQDPNEALIDSMPVKSIKTGMVDKILTIEEIINYVNQSYISKVVTV